MTQQNIPTRSDLFAHETQAKYVWDNILFFYRYILSFTHATSASNPKDTEQQNMDQTNPKN